MFSVQDAWNRRNAALAFKRDLEKNLDEALRVMVDNDETTTAVTFTNITSAAGEYAASLYRARGWTVEVQGAERDRAYSPETKITLTFTLPEEPMRGGPLDR